LPGGRTLELHEHDGRPTLHVHGEQVVDSRTAAAEAELTRMACAPFRPARQPRIVVLGLGVGNILRAALDTLPQKRGKFLVAESIASLLAWHRAGLAGLDPELLANPRVELHPVESSGMLHGFDQPPHAIILHLDAGAVLAAGPDSAPTDNRSWLAAARDVLRPGGLLAIGSLHPQRNLTRHLQKAGFDVSESSVHGSSATRKPRPLWLARKRDSQ
jgi:hypothetical protein